MAGAAWPGLPPGAESHLISWVPRRGCGGALAPAPRRRCDRLWLCRPGCVRSSTRYTRRAARKRRRRSGPPSVAPPRLRALGGPQLSRQRRIRGSAKSYCRRRRRHCVAMTNVKICVCARVGESVCRVSIHISHHLGHGAVHISLSHHGPFFGPRST